MTTSSSSALPSLWLLRLRPSRLLLPVSKQNHLRARQHSCTVTVSTLPTPSSDAATTSGGWHSLVLLHINSAMRQMRGRKTSLSCDGTDLSEWHLETPSKWEFLRHHKGHPGRKAERKPSSRVLGEYVQRCVWKVPSLNVRPTKVLPTGWSKWMLWETVQAQRQE